MATIVISFDTNAKTVTATFDGAPIADFARANIGRCWSEDGEDGGKFYCDVAQMTVDKGNGVKVYTTTSAGEIPAPAEKADGPDAAAADVAAYFGGAK